MATNLLPIPGLEKKSEAFRQKLVAIASNLGLDPSAIAAVMKVESGFNAQARNPSGGAVGLIQFMPQTARDLGTSSEALLAMSDVDQLDYVSKFYEPLRGKIVDDGDHYVAVFVPAFLGKPNSAVIAKRGEKIYDQNAGLDVSKDGILTVQDVKDKLGAVIGPARAAVQRGGKPIAVESPKAEAEEGSASRSPAASPPTSLFEQSRAAARELPRPEHEARLERRISRYFSDHPEGLSPEQIRAWIATVRRGGGFTQEECNAAFRSMMGQGLIAIANGTYYWRPSAPRAAGPASPAPGAERRAARPDPRQEAWW